MKSKIISILFLILMIFVSQGLALAQDRPGDLPQGGIVSKKVAAGTVVAAAMESIGYQAQAQVLTQLKDTMEELGGLIYLGILLSVILTAALMGSYAPVLWLLVGPPIFIYVSGVEINSQHNRISANGPDWKFGAFKDQQNFKQKVMRRSDNNVEVSFFFHKYNELISEIYQEIIRKITSNDEVVPMMFMARERIMEDLFGLQLRDNNALQLAGTFLTQCSSELTLARYIASAADSPGIQNESQHKANVEEYCRMYGENNKKINDTALEDYLTTLTPKHVKGLNVNCALLWVWLRQVTVKDLASQAETSLMSAFGPEAATAAIGVQGLATKVFDDILKKFFRKRKDKTSVTDICPLGSGGELTEGIISKGDSFSSIANILSGLMIRKEQIKGTATNFQRLMGGDHSGITALENAAVGGVRASVQGSEDQLRRVKSQEQATARKYEAFTFLMVLPYFQGAILYALALLYPFFSFLVLVPGKADGFLNWLALWAWVKSWDIGWAVVMVTDKLLWEIMPHTTYYDLSDQSGYTPVNLMEMHYSGDFAYSLALYWTVVAALITSVPIITAEIILGAKKGISSVLLSGATDISERLSMSAANFVASQSIGRSLSERHQRESLAISGSMSQTARGNQEVSDKVNKNLGNESPVESQTSQPGKIITGQAPATTSADAGEQQLNRTGQTQGSGSK
jgi:hypothetical protein